MTNIVNLEDHRPQPVIGPVEVSFFGIPFEIDGEQQQLTLSVIVENGDFQGAIDSMRDNGGLYVEGDPSGAGWYLPWPCAAVRVRPAQRI